MNVRLRLAVYILLSCVIVPPMWLMCLAIGMGTRRWHNRALQALCEMHLHSAQSLHSWLQGPPEGPEEEDIEQEDAD